VRPRAGGRCTSCVTQPSPTWYEQNVSLPLLMAKSRHASLQSLQRYARPGPEAVAALTAATDPARRRS
jgi:hypothetical protein